jgi:hypothetical protein
LFFVLRFRCHDLEKRKPLLVYARRKKSHPNYPNGHRWLENWDEELEVLVKQYFNLEYLIYFKSDETRILNENLDLIQKSIKQTVGADILMGKI